MTFELTSGQRRAKRAVVLPMGLGVEETVVCPLLFLELAPQVQFRSCATDVMLNLEDFS